MQPYKNGQPMGEPTLLDDDPEIYKKQIEDAFDNGADEVKVFKPTPNQLKRMRKNERKKKRRNMAKKSRKINRNK